MSSKFESDFVIEGEQRTEESRILCRKLLRRTPLETHLRADIIKNLPDHLVIKGLLRGADCLVTISCEALKKIHNEVHPGAEGTHGIQASPGC